MGAWSEGARKILTPLPFPGKLGTSYTALFSAEQGAELGIGPGNEEGSPSGARLPYPGTQGQATWKVCEETEEGSPSEATHSGPGCLDSRAPATPSFAAAQPCLPVSFPPYGPHCWAGACVRPAWAAPWDMAGEPHSWVISPPPSGIQDTEPFPLPPSGQLFLV